MRDCILTEKYFTSLNSLLGHFVQWRSDYLQTMTTGFVNGGGLGKHRYARWNREDSGEDYGREECCGGDEEGRQQRLTPLEKLMQDMSHNEKVVKELTLGKRIGFYRVRGEIGSGNFSQVKLGIHSLTKGRHCRVRHLASDPPSSVYTRVDLFGKKNAAQAFNTRASVMCLFFLLCESVSRYKDKCLG